MIPYLHVLNENRKVAFSIEKRQGHFLFSKCLKIVTTILHVLPIQVILDQQLHYPTMFDYLCHNIMLYCTAVVLFGVFIILCTFQNKMRRTFSIKLCVHTPIAKYTIFNCTFNTVFTGQLYSFVPHDSTGQDYAIRRDACEILIFILLIFILPMTSHIYNFLPYCHLLTLPFPIS